MNPNVTQLGGATTPLGHVPQLGHATTPSGYATTPSGYATTPSGYATTPSGYATTPLGEDTMRGQPQSKTHRLQLTSMKQLIDLNGDMTNFKLKYTVNPQSDGVYDLLVLDQTILDSTSNLDYQRFSGPMNGDVASNNGVYKTYFLLLRSDDPMNVEVTVDIVEIPQASSSSSSSSDSSSTEEQKFYKTTWFKVCIILLIIGGIGGYYYYVYRLKKSSNSPSTVNVDDNVLPPSPPQPTIVQSSSPPQPIVDVATQLTQHEIKSSPTRPRTKSSNQSTQQTPKINNPINVKKFGDYLLPYKNQPLQ